MHASRSPRISVVIPAYNCEGTIRETIQSVLDQTLEDFELLVINDGSGDGTLDVLARFRDPRLRVQTYENAGLSASRNRGIALSRGEFIAFLDADDLWTEDKLADQYAALIRNPEAAVAYSLTDHIDMQGRYLGPCCHEIVTGEAFAAFLKSNFLANGSNPLIRRSALDEVGGFDADFNPAEDWDLYMRLAFRFPYVCVPKAQILYRLNPNSMSSNVRKMEEAILKVLDKGRSYGRRPDPDISRLSLALVYRYLTVRSLQGLPTRESLVLTGRYWWTWVRQDSLRCIDGRIKVRAHLLKLYLLVKMALWFLLPRSVAVILLGEIENVLVAMMPESPLPFAHATRRTFMDHDKARARRIERERRLGQKRQISSFT